MEDASEFLAEVVALFLEEVPPRLEALRHALETADRTEVRRLAFHLRGWCATVGAKLCEHLEACAKAMDLAAGKLALDRLTLEFARTVPALEVLRRP